MDILEVLNYLADKYNFDADDLSLIDEIIDQIVNNGDYEYDKDREDYDEDDKYEDEEYDYAEER